VPGISGFFAAAGACGAGVILSADMGFLTAELALGQEPSFDITSFRPDRFGLVDPFGEAFQEQCAAARASKFRKSP